MYQNNYRQNNFQSGSNVISNRIYVSGIPPTASQDELKYYFSSFGPVKDARIITDQVTGTSRGFGFVTYDSNDDAAKVLGMSEQDLMFKESKLSVNPAYRNHNNNRQGGGGGGGFNSRFNPNGGGGHRAPQGGQFDNGFQSYNNQFGGQMRYGQ